VPLSLFGSFYLATFLACAWLTGPLFFQWDGLIATIGASAATIVFIENGRWRIGLAAPPLTVARELLVGIGFAVVLIGAGDIFIMASTNLRHAAGSGFPWPELLFVYLPAVFHEELLFRGYPYQKVRAFNRGGAIIFTASVFAVAHGRNAGASPLAIVNLVLAGVLLALAYEVHQRLWLPIGIHLGWNLLSGPVLGYHVSGYVPRHTVLSIAGGGPDWLTGGWFGIEASAWLVVVEIAGIAVLTKTLRHKR
jgi:membrane protease YdiL (CAAX protease family)